MKQPLILIVLGLALLWMTGSAAAIPINTYAVLTDYSSKALSCKVSLNGGVSSEDTYVGIYQFNQTTAVGQYYGSHLVTTSDFNGALDAKFNTFCIDISQFVYGGAVNHWSEMRQLGQNVDDGPWPGPNGNPMTLAQQTNLLKLFYNHSSVLTGSSTVADAAFGAAVWEIVWESGSTLDVTTGNLRVDISNDSAETMANQWLSALAGTVVPTTGWPFVECLLDPTTQDQVVFITGGTSIAPIPEPVTMAGVLFGIGGLVTYVRKRRTA